jgi:hypothetical protein
VSSPDVEALEDDFVWLSMRNEEKELSVCVTGLLRSMMSGCVNSHPVSLRPTAVDFQRCVAADKRLR